MQVLPKSNCSNPPLQPGYGPVTAGPRSRGCNNIVTGTNSILPNGVDPELAPVVFKSEARFGLGGGGGGARALWKCAPWGPGPTFKNDAFLARWACSQPSVREFNAEASIEEKIMGRHASQNAGLTSQGPHSLTMVLTVWNYSNLQKTALGAAIVSVEHVGFIGPLNRAHRRGYEVLVLKGAWPAGQFWAYNLRGTENRKGRHARILLALRVRFELLLYCQAETLEQCSCQIVLIAGSVCPKEGVNTERLLCTLRGPQGVRGRGMLPASLSGQVCQGKMQRP